jgi:hypothetical protein
MLVVIAEIRKGGLQMIKKRILKASDLVNDIRSGMDDSVLMVKYSLTAKGLESAFKKLLEAKALTRGELYSRSPLRDDTVMVENLRAIPRNFLTCALSIQDVADPDKEGNINDISERGLQVTGIKSEVGQVKEFVIPGSKEHDLRSCSFKAECRWVSNGDRGNDIVSGYQIMEIDDPDLKQIQKIIKEFSLGG